VDAHVERVRKALVTARENIVGDFRFGVVEGKQMASGPVQNVVTIQNVSESIISIVQAGHLTSNYQELGRRLAETLKSDEVERVAPADKEEVSDLAGIVKDKLAKASPDRGRLRRGIERLSKALGGFGASVASGTLSKLIADFLTS
jgi:hypothetical protein